MKRNVFLLFAFYFLSFFSSCHRETADVSPETQLRQDSLALHVAVMPVMDCLPFYYAQRMGLFREAGVDVRLHEYLSQMDCDTALLGGWDEVAYTDIPRTLEMQNDSTALRVIMSMEGKLKLVTARTKRIRTLRHLDEHMIAIDRLSTADYLSDRITAQAGLEQTAVYRPQINNIQLRRTMLMEQLVDAALLPEPYATQARLKGNRILPFAGSGKAADSLRNIMSDFNGLVVRKELLSDTMRCRQVKLLIQVYNRSIDALNTTPERDTLRSIFSQQYDLPAEVTDSIKLPAFRKAQLCKKENVDAAYSWLMQRERRIYPAARDSLLSARFIPGR